jgi:hypothetical protein
MEQFKMFQAVWGKFAKNPGMVVDPSCQDVIYMKEKARGVTIREDIQDALVWYDYFSIPQVTFDADCGADLAAAVGSIHSYIQRATYFTVICPSAEHEELADVTCDYASWRCRGWCRLEATSRFLSESLEEDMSKVILIRSPETVVCAAMADMPHNPVGNGEFTCCAKHHQFTLPSGKTITMPCDKQRIYGVMKDLADAKVRRALEEGDLFKYRWFRALKRTLLCGLPAPAGDDPFKDEETLANFLKAYRFDSPHDSDGGWTPLRYACISGNVAVVRELIAVKVDVTAPLEEPSNTTSHPEGSTILHSACRFCGLHDTNELAILDMLVDAGADLFKQTTDVHNMYAWGFAISVRNVEGANWWYRCVERTKPGCFYNECTHCNFGNTALMVTAIWMDEANFRNYLAMDPDPARRSCANMNAVHMMALWNMEMKGGDCLADVLGKTKHDVNDIPKLPEGVHPKTGMDYQAFYDYCHHKKVSGEPINQLEDVIAVLDGGTPIVCAAYNGRVSFVRELLRLGADPRIKNRLGMTARDVAESRGWKDVVKVLEDYEDSEAQV